MAGRYRDGVCAVIRHPSGDSVLVCHRSDAAEDEGWQFPQGGVKSSRDLVEEMKRELREEIGTDNVSIVSIADKKTKYDFPEYAREAKPKYKGQKHRWVLADFQGDDSEIHFDHEPAEFDDFEWVSPSEAMSRVVDFKKKMYRQGLSDLGLI